MIVRALLSALHLLALGIGLGAVVVRGGCLRDLRRSSQNDAAVRRLLRADSLWGLAALLWVATGLIRVFGRLEKTPDFYLRNGFFWVKMALFALVLLLELRPMLTFIRWRKLRSGGTTPAAGAGLAPLIALNDAEVAIIVLIPLVAALMTRGAWLF